MEGTAIVSAAANAMLVEVRFLRNVMLISGDRTYFFMSYTPASE